MIVPAVARTIADRDFVEEFIAAVKRSGMHGKAGIKRIFLDVAYWPLTTTQIPAINGRSWGATDMRGATSLPAPTRMTHTGRSCNAVVIDAA